MPYCDWEDENWDTLIYAIQEKDCILMLGPDAAVQEVDGQQRPLMEILANQLAEKIDPEIKKQIDISDLSQVSQYYSKNPGKHDLYVQVKSFYKEKENLTTDLHRNLAALPFCLAITTTPDNMFANALREENKDPVIDWYNFRGTEKVGPKLNNGKPLVFYLYGNIEEPKSLLLAENDLLDFLVALISRKPRLQDSIRSELQNEDKSFLFFGFGFQHWYLRILLHVLQGKQKNSRSFALEQFTPGNIDELRRTVFFFKKNDHKIHIFKQDFKNFARQLRERFEKCSPEIITRVETERKPEVFICHDSENKEYASSLYKKLEAAGLRPWMDKENLRGGDEWDKVIKETIEQIDYFVVLQSKALSKKTESYVFLEIEAALERQKRFRSGIRFIIPTKVEECPLEKDLKHLQTLDMTGESNFDELISIIKRDFEKRNKQ